MAAPPAPKRRRLTEAEEAEASEVGAPMRTLIRRKADDVLHSMMSLHAHLETYADVLICARGTDGSEVELMAVSALIAAASRPLGAMLYGPMRMCTPRTGDDRPRLQLSLTQPAHLRHLLDFIHGQDLRACSSHKTRPCICLRAHC